MIVFAKKSFNKDIEKINDNKLAKKIKGVILSVEKANAIIQIHNVKKLKGTANAYRIRIGDYRLGFFFINNVVELTAFAHRKEIYRYFP